MLGSLARKLRALGFDTDYYKNGDDLALRRLASGSGRVILTADRALAQGKVAGGARAILVKGRDDRQRVRVLAAEARRLGIPLVRGESLCSICGSRLEALSRSDVAGRVPRQVERRHRLFYKCSECGQIYWHGSHWKKLRSLASLLKEEQRAIYHRRRSRSGRTRQGYPRGPCEGQSTRAP